MKKLKQHKEKIIGLIITLIFIALICWNLDFKQLVATFKIFDYRVLLIFVPLYISGLYLRGVRWKYLLCDSKKLTVKEAFFAFTTGNTLNSYLPARAGDFWRAFHIGKKLEESKMKILGSIILERIIDGVSVLLILAFAVLTYFKHPWVLKITYVASSLFIGSLIVFFLIFKFNKTTWFFNKLAAIPALSKFEPAFIKISGIVNRFMEGFQALNKPKCLLMAYATSCLAWGIECIITYILVLGFGQHYGFSIALFIISFIALSTIIPSSSVFVGPYQYAYILALGIYHIEKSYALGIAFIHQITIMLTITVISMIYFLFTNTKIQDIKEEIEEEMESPSDSKEGIEADNAGNA